MPERAEGKDFLDSLVRQFSKTDLGICAKAFLKHLAGDVSRGTDSKTGLKFFKAVR